MKNSININDCPNLFNLLTLNDVIPQNTFVEDTDSGEPINLNRLIDEALKELQTAGVWGF